MALTREDYRHILDALAPPGQALPSDRDSVWQRLLGAIAEPLARADATARSLIEEADPRTASVLFTDWERATGLPDPCLNEEQSTSARRNAVLRVLTSTGGQSPPYFIELADTLGYEIEIEEYTPHDVGDDVSNALHGRAWRWAWTVRAAEETVETFSVADTVRDALASWGNELIECVIERHKPAHTHVLFAYGE